MEHRPDPDELLKQVQAEETKRGRLKIFLGYAAGVGKTFAMLEAAHQRKAQGVDVVIGYVETHKRVETEELVEGLEVLPLRQVEYHNVTLSELDVDALLIRHPALALVDEFAHTNAPGSRHPKRYQDVEEILDAGIDVYTTLNIQHLESLNDVVAQVTGVIVRETIPDSAIDESSEIEVVDLPPDELLARLTEGKVYVPEQAVRAIQQFFRKGNLTALRELTMRRAADRVEDQMRDYMQSRSIPGPWAANERVMVCISSHPLSERLVRAGRRLADELNTDWFVVYVQTPERIRYSASYNERVAQTVRLAEELGASVRQLAGRNMPEAVIDFARKNNITKIIIGKPIRPRWQEFLSGSVVDEVIRLSGNIDVHVVSDVRGPLPTPITSTLRRTSPWRNYLLSTGLIVIVTLVCFPIKNILHPANLVMPYLGAVVVAAVFLGRGPSMLASLLSVLAFDFFFIQPFFTFNVSDTQYVITFIGLFLVGLVISNLAGLVRDQVDVLKQQERQSSTLYALSRELSVSRDLDTVLRKVIEQISQTFSREVVILLPQDKSLEVRAASQGFVLDDNERAVATWAYEHDQPAGRGTDTLPAAEIRYQPLRTTRGVVGVLGVKPRDDSHYLSPDQRQTLDAYASLAGLAIDRTRLMDQAYQAEILEITDKLQSALLNSISHDLRTPLVSITGALSSLADENARLDDASRHSLIETARGEADRLNRLVGNLLDMSRLEAGVVRLHKEESDIQDVIGSALEQLRDHIKDRSVTVDTPAELPLIPMDFVLISRVIVNVIDNALKYSKSDSPVEIKAKLAGAYVEIEVADRGAGIPPEDLSRVFDKFYRVQRPDNITGTGLGLSISKGIIQAHGGFIGAENRPGGGTIITLALPLK